MKPKPQAPAVPPRPRVRKHLTVAEWRALLQVTRQRESARPEALVLSMYECGLRAGEVGLLRVAYVDARRSRLYTWRAKGSVDSWVDISPAAVNALSRWVLECYGRWPEGGYLFPGQPYLGRPAVGLTNRMVGYIFKGLAREAKLHPLLQHSHVLKHSRVQHLLEAVTKETGDPWGAVQVIAQIVGHASAVTTVQNYVASMSTKEQVQIAKKATARLTE